MEGAHAVLDACRPYCSCSQRLNFVPSGGLFVSITGDSWTSNNCDDRNSLSSDACHSVHLVDVNVTNNSAKFGGGGLFITEPDSLYSRCHILHREDPTSKSVATAINNTIRNPGANPLSDASFRTNRTGCLAIQGNSVGRGGFGDVAATLAVAVSLLNPNLHPIMNHTSRMNLDEGTGGILLRIEDAFGQTVRGGIPDSRKYSPCSDPVGDVCCERRRHACSVWCLRTVLSI